MPLVFRGDFVRVFWFAPQCERKLSSTIVAIAFACGSRNVDEKGGIEEADTNGNSVNEHAPLLRRKYLVVPPTEKARAQPRPMSCSTTANG